MCKNFSNMQNIKVPISNLTLNVSFTFSNTKIKAKTQPTRKIDSEFKEQRSQGEVLNGATMQ